jgi:hypothetical protein
MPLAIACALTSKPVFNVEQELCFCSESLLTVANKTPTVTNFCFKKCSAPRGADSAGSPTA